MNSRRLMMRPMTVEDAHSVQAWHEDQSINPEGDLKELISLEDWRGKILNQAIDEKLLVITDQEHEALGYCRYHKIQNKSCHIGFFYVADLPEDLQQEGMQLLAAFLMGTLGFKMIFTEVGEVSNLGHHFQAIGFEKTGILEKSNGRKENTALLTLTLDAFKKNLNQPFVVV